MPVAPSSTDSESLVARIIAELRADPDAQTLLLRALLTNEWLGMPIRLERMEAAVAELNTRLTRVEADVADMKPRLARVEADVAVLKGDSLEAKLHRRIRSLLSRRLDLRRAQILQSPVQDTRPELFEPVEKAFDAGNIDDKQETRINAADFVVRARRKADQAPVWVVVEVSNAISRRDIERARQTADALNAVFPQDALAAVVGYRIQPQDRRQADTAGVHALLVDGEK